MASKFEDNVIIKGTQKIDERELMINFNYNDETINFDGRATYVGDDVDAISIVTAKPIVAKIVEEALKQN